MTTPRTTTPAQLTSEVLRAYRATEQPRLREILQSLISHLHAFVAETSVTGEEWRAGIQFLTDTGHMCDDVRQEFILLSDILGVSSLVDLLGYLRSGGGGTESTVLGPFYRPGAPHKQRGEHIGRPEDGEPTLVRGRVTDLSGRPIAGASLDVWQTAANGLYDVQDPQQPPVNLRGVFTTGLDGTYEFRTARPVSYPIPTDGPAGRLLRACGRHAWRAAHIHAIVGAPGYQPVTTHIFDSENEYLGSDTVFAVKDSLVRQFAPAGEAGPPDVRFVVDMDFALRPVPEPATGSAADSRRSSRRASSPPPGSV